MSKTNEYNIKDMALADQGLKRINWAKNHMPIMRNLISRLEKEKPFEGLTIGICLHVEAKTGVWVEALTRGGAKIAVTGSVKIRSRSSSCSTARCTSKSCRGALPKRRL
ncbi:adenosylhomocysteinase [Salmonella enterica]|nr:adenosylhomocysteinase [Salmonella enterica]